MDTSYYNRFGAEELARRLSSETLLAQGPMGSVLLSEYDAADIPPAFWNLAEPQTVSRIHRLYVAAGAQVLITNTFQASSYALKHDQIAPSVAEVNRGPSTMLARRTRNCCWARWARSVLSGLPRTLPSIVKSEALRANRRTPCSMPALTVC